MPRGGYRENAGGWNAKGFFGSVKLDTVSGCWNWQGTKHKFGYGKASYLGKRYDAHRLAAILWLRLPTDSPLVVRHKCDNPACCNPKHLELGTHRDNVLDMISRHGHYKTLRTHCPQGHEFSKENTFVSKCGKFRRCRTCDRNHRRKYGLSRTN